MIHPISPLHRNLNSFHKDFIHLRKVNYDKIQIHIPLKKGKIQITFEIKNHRIKVISINDNSLLSEKVKEKIERFFLCDFQV